METKVRSMRIDDDTMALINLTSDNASETIRKAIMFYYDNKDRITPEYEKKLNEYEKKARYWQTLADRAPEEAKTDIEQGNLENLKLVNASYTGGNDSKDVQRLKEMLPFFNISYDRLMKMIKEGLENGDITVKRGHIRAIPEYRLDELIETCKYNHVDPGRAIHLLEIQVKDGRISCNS